MKKIVIIIIAAILLVSGWLYFVKGYVGIRAYDAVPERLIASAKVLGDKNVRIILDPLHLKSANINDTIFQSGLSRPSFDGPEANVLVISGGGANGAYASGILCGWTKSAKRPTFDIVTGVSTGALIAPCAFLGPSYDHTLRDIYTNVSNADIARENLISLLIGDKPSLLDTKPLRGILKRMVTMEVLRDVAKAQKNGRRLYIATTNLDARRAVIWDMGAIASVGTSEALELFREVMLASTSIPVAFPPVMITVEAEGRTYDEMHVDGSVATQMFGALLIAGPVEEEGIKTNVFVIRNGKIADVPGEVKYSIWSIAEAAFSTLVTWQSYGDLARFASMTKDRKNISLFATFIPYDFNEPRKGEFDPKYMNKLFEIGYEYGASGSQWVSDAASPLHKFFDQKDKSNLF